MSQESKSIQPVGYNFYNTFFGVISTVLSPIRFILKYTIIHDVIRDNSIDPDTLGTELLESFADVALLGLHACASVEADRANNRGASRRLSEDELRKKNEEYFKFYNNVLVKGANIFASSYLHYLNPQKAGFFRGLNRIHDLAFHSLIKFIRPKTSLNSEFTALLDILNSSKLQLIEQKPSSIFQALFQLVNLKFPRLSWKDINPLDVVNAGLDLWGLYVFITNFYKPDYQKHIKNASYRFGLSMGALVLTSLLERFYLDYKKAPPQHHTNKNLAMSPEVTDIPTSSSNPTPTIGSTTTILNNLTAPASNNDNAVSPIHKATPLPTPTTYAATKKFRFIDEASKQNNQTHLSKEEIAILSELKSHFRNIYLSLANPMSIDNEEELNELVYWEPQELIAIITEINKVEKQGASAQDCLRQITEKLEQQSEFINEPHPLLSVIEEYQQQLEQQQATFQ